MIRPNRARTIGRAARRATRNAPVRLVAITASQSSSLIRITSLSRVMPALAMTTSTGPRAASTSANAASTWPGSVTSHSTPSTPFGHLAAAVGRRHAVAGPVQAGGDPAADPLAAAGDQDHPGHRGIGDSFCRIGRCWMRSHGHATEASGSAGEQAYADTVSDSQGPSAPGSRRAPSPLITDARSPASVEHDSRVRRYAFTMGFRTACFISMIFVDGPLRWVLFAGAVILPYVAVIVANQANQRSKRVAARCRPVDRPQLTTGPEEDDVIAGAATDGTSGTRSGRTGTGRLPDLLLCSAKGCRAPATYDLGGTTPRSIRRSGVSTGWPAPTTGTRSARSCPPAGSSAT